MEAATENTTEACELSLEKPDAETQSRLVARLRQKITEEIMRLDEMKVKQ